MKVRINLDPYYPDYLHEHDQEPIEWCDHCDKPEEYCECP